MKLLVIAFRLCSLASFGSAALPTSDSWAAAVSNADALFYNGAEDLVPENLAATIGNGFVATTMPSSVLFVGGVFNGPAVSIKNPSHRAAIPSPLNSVVEGEDVIAAALSLREGEGLNRAFYLR